MRVVTDLLGGRSTSDAGDTPTGAVRRVGEAPASSDLLLGPRSSDAGVRDGAAAVASMFVPHVLLEAVRDDSGRVVDFVYDDANDAACEYNGVSRKVLIGSTLMHLLPAHASTGLLDMYVRVVETDEATITMTLPSNGAQWAVKVRVIGPTPSS